MLGIWDVERWLYSLPWHQARLWHRYAALEPFGETRADLRAGIVASVIANAHRDPKRGAAFQPRDFMPDFDGAAATSERGGGRGRRREPLTDPAQWRRLKARHKKNLAEYVM